MNRRLWINFAGVTVVLALLSVWAVNNVLRIDALERPRTITAEFETSPGLRSGFEVTYFGVHAGQLGSVALTGDHVTATLKIDRDLALPADLDAAVRRKSAVGEPYVDLTPTGGSDAGGPRLQAGTVIPMTRTSTPLSYSEVFTAVDDLITAIPPDTLGQLVHSLAAGFDGRADDIRRTFVSADQLTSTLAANAPLLDSLATDLTRLTHTLTDKRDTIASGFDNLAALSQLLAEQKDNVAALLDNAPTLLDQVNSLLAKSGPDIGCIFDAAGSVWSSINQPVNLNAFAVLVDLAGPAADIIRHIAYQGPDGLYLSSVITFNAGASPVTVYDPVHQLPAPPPLGACNVAGSSGTTGGNAPGAVAGAPPAPTGAGSVDVPERAGVTTTLPPSSTKPSDGGFDPIDYLPWAIGAALLVAAIMLAQRRWALRERTANPRTQEEEAAP